MTDKRIEPALSPEEWAAKGVRMPPPTRYEDGAGDWDVALTLRGENALVWEYMSEHCERETELRPLPALIALANAALPDDDPRKITREKVEALRAWVPGLNNHSGFRELAVLLHHHANALESYLPPRDP